MKDIAQELGLSIVTVSKVLRNHPDISEKTRHRVLDHVRERDYQPNVLARSLVTGRSFLVGLIVPDLIHPFFAEIARVLSLTIRAKGYSLLISSSEEDAELESQEIRQLVARRLDAIVIASTATTGERFDRLRQIGLPFVLIDRNFVKGTGNFVGVNDVLVGDMATEHLIQIGCKRIAHIAGQENSTGINRLRGYQKALLRHGQAIDLGLVIRLSTVDIESVEQGAHAVRQLLAREDRPDGIFCYNDPLAIGAMDQILRAGLRIPEDIAVIGCGNLHYDEFLRVPLSSIDQHNQHIGKWAGKIAMELIESKVPPPNRTIILKPSLIARSSTIGNKMAAKPAIIGHHNRARPAAKNLLNSRKAKT